MRVLAHLVKASCSMSRSAVWHAWRKYPTSALSAVALFLIKTKGWVFLEGIGQTAFYADVGDFLQEYHRSDLDREREALTRCTPILAYHPLARRLFKGTPVTTKIICILYKTPFKTIYEYRRLDFYEFVVLFNS